MNTEQTSENIFKYTSMAGLVVNSLEMWNKFSIPRVMSSFREKIIFQFLHHICREDNINQILNIYITNI